MIDELCPDGMESKPLDEVGLFTLFKKKIL